MNTHSFLVWTLGLLTVASVAQAQLAAPVPVFPANGSVFQNPGGDFSITLRWEAVEGAEQYQVNGQIRNASGQPVATLGTRTSQTEYTLPLSQSQTQGRTQIFWAVQSLEGGIPSAPSAFFEFLIDETGLSVPGFAPTPTPIPTLELLLPLDGAVIPETLINVPVSFQWEAVANATEYRMVIYLDNSLIQQRVLSSTFLQIPLGFVPSLTKTYQWQVIALDENATTISQSSRRSFTIGGSGLFPTPTPFINGADHDGNGRVDGRDLFFFAMRYRTNDPRVDYDQSGLNGPQDILLFVQRYLESNP